MSQHINRYSLYIDGVTMQDCDWDINDPIQVAAYKVYPNGRQTINIGAYNDDPNDGIPDPFVGYIDDVRIFAALRMRLKLHH